MDDDRAVAAVDDQHVAVGHLLANAAYAGDGRNAATSREDGGMARFAAGLRDDPRDFQAAERHNMPRQQLLRNDDHRPMPSDVAGRQQRREMAAQADHGVVSVGQALPQESVFRLLRQRGVFFKDRIEGGRRGTTAADDLIADATDEGRVAQDRFMRLEDAAPIGADLRTHFLLQSPQLADGLLDRLLEPPPLGKDFVFGQMGVLGMDEHLVDAVSLPDRHPRRNSDPFTHAARVTRRRGGNNETAVNYGILGDKKAARKKGPGMLSLGLPSDSLLERTRRLLMTAHRMSP